MKILVQFVVSLAFLITYIANPAKAFAATPPTFPACANPQGTVSASYPSGTFGIVGQTGSFQGSDTVYTLSDDTLTQCFCAIDGNGTQTDWWRVSSLTTDEINEMIALGWILIPDGSVWGLSADPYLAKNSTYSCNSGGGSTNGSSTSSSSNSSSNSNSGGTGGQVLGAATGSVLGLATTGNMQLALLLLAFGIFSLSTGVIIKRK